MKASEAKKLYDNAQIVLNDPDVQLEPLFRTIRFNASYGNNFVTIIQELDATLYDAIVKFESYLYNLGYVIEKFENGPTVTGIRISF